MKISDVARNAAADAVTALINAGTPPGHLYIRTGAAPTNTTDADSGTLLATLTFSNASFGAAASGVATAAAITSDTNIAATGTAGHYRIKNAAGTVIAQAAVGTSGTDINFNSVAFVSGGTCAISSLTLTVPAGSN